MCVSTSQLSPDSKSLEMSQQGRVFSAQSESPNPTRLPPQDYMEGREMTRGCGTCKQNRSWFTIRRPSSRWYTNYSLVMMILFMFLIHQTSALLCQVCDQTDCKELHPGDCDGGVTLDPCGCCWLCARTENQTCGGQYDMYGTCDDGLVCSIDPQPGTAITGHEVGICIKPGKSLID